MKIVKYIKENVIMFDTTIILLCISKYQNIKVIFKYNLDILCTLYYIVLQKSLHMYNGYKQKSKIAGF